MKIGKRSMIFAVLAVLGCFAASYAAQGLVVINLNKAKHPNMAAAQLHIAKAHGFVTKAQVANKYNLGGHAAQAKLLLEQASMQVELAAQKADAGSAIQLNKKR